MILFAQTDLMAEEKAYPGPRSAREPEVLLTQADEAYATGVFESARRDYQRLIERYPSHVNTMKAYPKLILIYAEVDHKPELVIRTIKNFLFLKPETALALAMKSRLSDAYLATGKAVEAKATSKEILDSKDASAELKTQALMNTALALTQQKRYTEALAKIDSIDAKDLPDLQKQIPALSLQIKTRQCSALTLPKKKKYTDDDYLGFYSEKNTCFKSLVPAGTSSIDEKPLEEWCVAQQSFEAELTKRQMDPFLKQKISKPISETATFAKSVNAAFGRCKEAHEPTSDKK